MRILIVHECNLPYGGGERYVHDTCDALRELGHRVALVCAEEWNGGFIPSHQTYGVTRSVGLRTGLQLWGEYSTILRKETPDVVYLNGINRDFVSPYILWRIVRSRPSVLFVHNSGLFCHTARKAIPSTDRNCEWALGYQCFYQGCVRTLSNSRLHRLRMAFFRMWRAHVLRRCGRVIAPSRYVYDELLCNGFPAQRLQLLPLFTTKAREGLNIPMGYQILWVGRGEEGKGLHRFFHVLAGLSNQNWQATVVGPDTNTPEIRATAETLGIANRTNFRGRVDGEDIDKEYMAARVVVFTSDWAETFGQVGIEAMAFGKPVVAFDVGGVTEWLADGVTGFVVRRNDLSVMRDRLSRLLADDGLCVGMGKAGRAAVDARFQRHNHLLKLLTTFHGALYEWNAMRRWSMGT